MSYPVAPRVGAWIETIGCRMRHKHKLSHPVWVRGLKLRNPVPYPNNCVVAPRVGAWIETMNLFIETNPGWSHPVWVRGLKL